ncbi:cytochrome c oxidase subunit 6b-3 [Selaginella moellendorffii]|uniref:cytochrome c oxidase subunit 6b-3 n=1 Tax=Selaginella moellendorffii TaxID=88036 RepID=UPI000D1C7485|nr:cytochrome c oxidase subunit 6b-3 [Selaginella moellendorffii]|eukprot:XP_002965431.2 cytochrome c oxidase subunit 6b-3 [Selaginella moellendorffii]
MGLAQGKIAFAEVGEKQPANQAEDDTVVEVDDESKQAIEEEEAKEARRTITVADIKTAPFDIRFPSTNQTKHCYTRYIEFHKCQKERGEGAPECQKYARYYRSLCPSEWIERWNEQRADGVFCGPY